ncbi:MAG: hypothetical protein IE909_18240, partial [Campylobacterales bacterium]|nr:hypothetical protein [Campylobacterales bacterium]
MEWTSRLINGFLINGVEYDLGHLKAFEHSFWVGENETQEVKCSIRFDSHCCSKGLPRGDDHSTIPENELVIDSKGNPRRFCIQRYEASKALQDHLSRMDEQFFFEGAKGSENIFFVDLTVNEFTDTYIVIINISRSKKAGIHLDIYVESAFLQYKEGDPEYDPNKIMRALHEMVARIKMVKNRLIFVEKLANSQLLAA